SFFASLNSSLTSIFLSLSCLVTSRKFLSILLLSSIMRPPDSVSVFLVSVILTSLPSLIITRLVVDSSLSDLFTCSTAVLHRTIIAILINNFFIRCLFVLIVVNTLLLSLIKCQCDVKQNQIYFTGTNLKS